MLHKPALRFLLLLGLTALGVCVPLFAQVAPLPARCSSIIINRDCTIPIDRENAITPPTIQAYPNTTITIYVIHPRPFDDISIEPQSTKLIQPPEAIQSIAQAFFPNLKSGGLRFAFVPQPSKTIDERLKDLEGGQTEIKNDIDRLNNDLKIVNVQLKEVQGPPPATVGPTYLNGAGNPVPNPWNPDGFVIWRALLLCELTGELTPGVNLTGCAPTALVAGQTEQWLSTLSGYDSEAQALSALIDSTSVPDPSRPVDSQRLQTILVNQVLLKSSLKSIQDQQSALVKIVVIIQNRQYPSAKPQSFSDPSPGSHFYRQATYSVGVTNELAATPMKQQLVTVTVDFGSSRWEVFSGAIFSTLPNRSFMESPVIVNGFKTNTQIMETKAYPTVVPFASANYRIKEWAPGGRRWALYSTGGLGVNPYSGNVDFGAGMSVAYRSLVLSPLVHWAHDIRLTQGLYANELLGASNPPSLTTERYWRPVFGLAVCVRLSNLLTSNSGDKSSGK